MNRSNFKRLIGALLAMMLFLAACGGDPAPSSSVSPSPTADASVLASPSPSAEPTPSVAPAPSAAAPSPSPSPQPPQPAPAPPAPPESATGPAAPGQYIFDDKGLIKTIGCLTSNQPVPTPSRLNVQPANGDRQQIDREQTGNGGAGFVSKIVFEYRDDGAYIVSFSQRQTFSNQTVAIHFDANPPVLAIPSRPTEGQTGGFTLTSRDGRVRVETSTRVEALNEQVTLGQGSVVRAHRIVTASRITGQSDQGTLNLVVDRVSWYAPDSHLEVRDSTDTAGTVGLCRVDFTVESLARSV